VRQFLRDNMKVTAERTTHHARMTSTPTFSLENLVKDGILPPEYTASSDPGRLLNIVIKPEMVEILVAGDPGRNQSRAYMSNHVQGPPTSRRGRAAGQVGVSPEGQPQMNAWASAVKRNRRWILFNTP